MRALMNSHGLKLFKYISISTVLFAALLLAGTSGCRGRSASPAPVQYKDTQLLMGTTVTITLYGDTREKLKPVADAGFAEIKRLSTIFSRYDPNSELSHLNELAARGGTFPVSPEMATMLERCHDICLATGGAFDITVGPLSAVWRKARDTGQPPGELEILAAMGRMGCENLSVDASHRTATFVVPRMSLDLGGIAKGFITERAAQVIKNKGVSSALINAGGDITAVGEKPGGEPWALGIQNPRDPEDMIAKVLLKDAAVTTSGDYQQFFEKDGRRESHIIDPRTGHGAAETISVTVIAPEAELADALATALSVLGPDQGLKLLKDSFPQAKALIITPDKKLHYSPGFKEYIAKDYQ